DFCQKIYDKTPENILSCLQDLKTKTYQDFKERYEQNAFNKNMTLKLNDLYQFSQETIDNLINEGPYSPIFVDMFNSSKYNISAKKDSLMGFSNDLKNIE
ncbi:MAG: hypothetical protein ACU836_19160, partial [Gammaproteobacteria bacterium]